METRSGYMPLRIFQPELLKEGKGRVGCRREVGRGDPSAGVRSRLCMCVSTCVWVYVWAYVFSFHIYLFLYVNVCVGGWVCLRVCV